MFQSAMSRVVVATAGPGRAEGVSDREGRLRRAVLAGPDGAAEVDDGVSGSVLKLLADPDVIAAGLARAGHVDRRRRTLTGMVTVLAILGLCLFRRDNYDLVLARIAATLPAMVAPGDGPPSGQALSQARARLVGEPMREVFTAAAAAAATAEPARGSHLFGLLVTAFDGTVLDLAATGGNADVFATPSGGRFPQARLVTLVACGTRRVLAAAVDSAAVSEQALVDQLAAALTPGTLNLADRNFFSMARWTAFADTGAQLAWRVKNGSKSLPAKLVQVLPDGSALVRLHESDAMLAARRRKTGDRSLTRLPQAVARLVEFTIGVTDRRGRTRTSRFRILTTLLEHHRYPAGQIASAYAERWQAEVAYLHLKVTLRGARTRLRAHSPHLARQEIWGLLVIYNTLVDLAVQAALDLNVDPDQISFTAVLALTRTVLTADTACPGCGHRPSDLNDPTQTLTAAIAAHPLNRTDRQRTAPRTKTQRRTERTRNVSYTITIVTPNLPKAG